MDKDLIRGCLQQLDEELRKMGAAGEVCLYGGAVMCLVYDARPSTKDVDAVFRPTREVREAVKRVGAANDLGDDWLNDAVKGFVVDHPQKVLYSFPNLQVYVPETDYLLAMKTFAARVDATDSPDIRTLISLMGLKSPDEVFSIVEKYYPKNRIKPATQFFIEEIFSE